MSDTPETDAHEDAIKGFLSGRYPKEADAWPAFARSLERRTDYFERCLQGAQRENEYLRERLNALLERELATRQERDAALREVEELKRDARRYRYLRGNDSVFHVATMLNAVETTMTGEELDAAIDAALAAKGKP